MEHRPITYELNLKPDNALWGKTAHLLQPTTRSLQIHDFKTDADHPSGRLTVYSRST